MSFKVVLTNLVKRQITSWQLPDKILVDVHLRLADLSTTPSDRLVRMTTPFDGMVFPLEIIDPDNRLRVFQFLFDVCYGQDEVSLIVRRGAFRQSFGM